MKGRIEMNIEQLKEIAKMSSEERQKKIKEFFSEDDLKALDEYAEKVNKFSIIEGGKKDE
jgi:hypothetical protein